MARSVVELQFIHRTKLGTPPDKLGYRLQQRTQNSLGEWHDWEDVPVVEEEDVPIKEVRESNHASQ